jgi:LacI family transcriptional regulator
MAAGTRVDAIILSSPVLRDDRVRLLTELGMPFVLHGRTATDIPHAWLDIDNAGAFQPCDQPPPRTSATPGSP